MNSNIVHKLTVGGYFIGPLTSEQYQVILDALELATVWTDRDFDSATAKALRNMIPQAVDVVVEEPPDTSGPSAKDIFNNIPNVDDVESRNPGDPGTIISDRDEIN